MGSHLFPPEEEPMKRYPHPICPCTPPSPAPVLEGGLDWVRPGMRVAVKANLESQLEHTYLQRPDGTRVPMKKRKD